jgi:hypothetical protein
MKKLFGVLLLMTLWVSFTQARDNTIPFILRYFETDDVLLEQGQSQSYQFLAFRNEEVTIVVYGLDGLIEPEINLYDSNNELVQTGESRENTHIRFMQFTASQDGVYTFVVIATYAEPSGGLARVMLVEGDPIDGDLTYLDTVNPLLPGRVFMVAGSDEIDTNVTATEVGLRTGAEVLPVERFRDKPDIFVSRGTLDELPPIEERFSPNQSHVWFNEGNNEVYFFTVHAVPEQLTSVTRDVEYEALNTRTFFDLNYFFIVSSGSDPLSE